MTQRSSSAKISGLHRVAVLTTTPTSSWPNAAALTGEYVVHFETLEQLQGHSDPLTWHLIIMDHAIVRERFSIGELTSLRELFANSTLLILEEVGSPSVPKAASKLGFRTTIRPTDDLAFAILIRDALSGIGQSFDAIAEPTSVSGARPTRNPRQSAMDLALTMVRMHFQPIVQWSTRSVFGYEALCRCEHPSFRNPQTLFDEAESLDRLQELSRCARSATGALIGSAPLGVKSLVNIHVRDLLDEELFNPDGPLAKNPAHVVIEITERASLLEIPDAHARIARLRSMGYRIALDDLGAGYSGLTLVGLIEPEIVKIDMSLVRDIHLSKTRQLVVRSLLRLAVDIGAETICEGIETREERDVLIDLGCDLYQGYFFGRPASGFTAPKFD